MAVSYNEGNLAYMRQLAKEQGISVAELTRRRRLDEEFGSPAYIAKEKQSYQDFLKATDGYQDHKEHMQRIDTGLGTLYPGEAADRHLGLTAATPGEFEPVLNYKPGKGTASHQDTSHIGAEERATGKTLGSTAGSVAGAILGPMVGIPPQVGSAIGGAAGGAIGGGGDLKESAIATGAGAGDAYAKEIAKGKDGKAAGDVMTKIKGIFN